MNGRHAFSRAPTRASDITDTEGVSPQATTAETATNSSSTQVTPKSVTASRLLAAFSAWATSCSQARSRTSPEETKARSKTLRSD
jgi:hypothetical protein